MNKGDIGMEYEIYKNGEQVLLNEEQTASIIRIIESYSQTKLLTKSITDIKGFFFFIRDYQRGYRWTESEIEELLADIENIDDSEKGYCMQPLIVKKIDTINAKNKLASNGLTEVVSEGMQTNKEGIYDESHCR